MKKKYVKFSLKKYLTGCLSYLENLSKNVGELVNADIQKRFKFRAKILSE